MFSEPAIGEDFFGREDILDLLNKRACALKEGYRQNVALTGQGLAGKSSIIYQFLYTMKEEDLIPVYIEVIKEPFKAFSNKFIGTLIYSALRKMGEPVDADMPSLMEKARTHFPKTSLAIKLVNSCIEREQFDEAYSNLLTLTSILKDETHIPCIVILDEFDNLEHLGVKNPFLSFGKVIMVQKDTMYIVSSSRNQAIRKILSEKLSLLFGNFEVVRISGFSFKASSKFLDARLTDFDIDAIVKKFLIAFTDGNPFYLSKIVNRAKEIASMRMSNYIDEDVIREAIIDLVYNPTGVIHQYLLNFILDLIDSKYRESYISILLSIANSRNRQPEISRSLRTKHQDLSKGLLRLLELGIISKYGVFYKIEDPVLEFWLKFVYQRRRELFIDGVINKMDLFKEDLKVYISSLVQEFKSDIASRLSGLFNQFSNELVQVDSRSIRLPHFTKVEVKNFPDGKSFIAASSRGKFWIAQAYDYEIGENDIIDYIRDVKSLGYNISSKIIMPLNGIDENAKLLAKELKLATWEISVVNTLLNLYGKSRIVIL